MGTYEDGLMTTVRLMKASTQVEREYNRRQGNMSPHMQRLCRTIITTNEKNLMYRVNSMPSSSYFVEMKLKILLATYRLMKACRNEA